MKQYRLKSDLSVIDSLGRVEELLRYESVVFVRRGKSITSVSTPRVVVGFDRRLYTKKNWVGVNPFIFVSGVEVECSEDARGVAVRVSISQKRTAIIYFLMLVNAFAVASALPNHFFGVIFFALFAIVPFFFLFVFFGGWMIAKEIESVLMVR